MKQNNSKISFRLYTMLVILWCIGIHITTYAQTMLEEEACEPLVLPEDVVCESNSIFPQFICKLDGREKIFEPLLLSSSGLRNWTEQIADIAYHPQSNSLFIPLNHSISHPYTYWTDVKSNDFIRGYDIENETLFKATIVGFDFYDVSADFEGLTHLKDNYFVLLDEGLNRIYFLEYLAEDRQFNVLSGHDTWIPRNTDLDPDYIDFFHNGLKGVSYDPNTNRLYMISEVPVEISGQKGRTLFSAALTLPSEESTGDIHEISSARLDHIIGSDASGIFHLGNIYPSNSAKSNNILVLSKVDKRVWEIGLTLEENNNLYECSASKINFFCIESEYKPTGMVVAGDKIYFTDISDYFSDISDKGGLSSYTIKSENDSCDDNSNNIYDQDCACIEKPACKSDLQISSNNDDNNNMLNSLDVNYSSSQSISTQFDETNDNPDIIIQKNEAVNLMSDHITLNVGFKVENGACLNATIEPCE